MGCTGSKRKDDYRAGSKPEAAAKSSSFFSIKDKYQTLEGSQLLALLICVLICVTEVQMALRKAGLESSNLIIGIDYTKSNTWNGKNVSDFLT